MTPASPPPIFAKTDAEGLGTIKAQAKAGPYLCEPALARAGRAAGFEVGEPPVALLRKRAALGVFVALGKDLVQVNGDVVLAFLDAAAAFCRAKPWRHVDSDATLFATVVGPNPLHFEASVLGAGGQEFGVALYAGTGTVATIRSLMIPAAAAEFIDSFAVTFDEGPKFAADALSAAFDRKGVPISRGLSPRSAPSAAGRRQKAHAHEPLLEAVRLADVLDTHTLDGAPVRSHDLPRRLETMRGLVEIDGAHANRGFARQVLTERAKPDPKA